MFGFVDKDMIVMTERLGVTLIAAAALLALISFFLRGEESVVRIEMKRCGVKR